jgi:hypothetical protein
MLLRPFGYKLRLSVNERPSARNEVNMFISLPFILPFIPLPINLLLIELCLPPGILLTSRLVLQLCLADSNRDY